MCQEILLVLLKKKAISCKSYFPLALALALAEEEEEEEVLLALVFPPADAAP
jgi:hypothetical protein